MYVCSWLLQVGSQEHLTLSGRRQDLLTLTIFPAVLNACSAGTEVAGIPRYYQSSTGPV